MKLSNDDVRTMLGQRANEWSDKGINFIRSRLAGTQFRSTMRQLLHHYVRGTLNEIIPPHIQDEVKEIFGVSELRPEHILIWANGRNVSKSRTGKFQETPYSWDNSDEGVLKALAANKLRILATPLNKDVKNDFKPKLH